MTKTLILYTRAMVGEHSGFDEETVAVLELTPELVQRILARAKLLADAKVQDKALIELYFWDRGASYYSLRDRLSDDARDALLGEDPVVLAHNPFADDTEENTECDQMIVSDYGVSWLTMSKHSETYAQTPFVSLTELQKHASPTDPHAPARRA